MLHCEAEGLLDGGAGSDAARSFLEKRDILLPDAGVATLATRVGGGDDLGMVVDQPLPNLEQARVSLPRYMSSLCATGSEMRCGTLCNH